MTTPPLISLHGGHSGQFCLHAQDTLDEVVTAYEGAGFSWAGITEHMPPAEDRFLYRDEQEAGLTAGILMERFDRYITTCRQLQQSHSNLDILVGFETETTTGAIDLARNLIEKYRPDYIVGSVHHVDDINFDFDESHYQAALRQLGGIDRLYHRYFDLQYEMITALHPQVVGHFDLIRVYDPAYPERMGRTGIMEKIERNLAAVRELGLVLDLNMRALVKGAREPYPSLPILKRARQMGIPVVPGDDSHGVDTVGRYIETGIKLLEETGFDTNWREIINKIKRLQ